MVCVRTPTLSLMMYETPTNFIGAQTGLRQGDPMFPLLFSLGMDYIDKILRYIGEIEGFKYHAKCKDFK